MKGGFEREGGILKENIYVMRAKWKTTGGRKETSRGERGDGRAEAEQGQTVKVQMYENVPVPCVCYMLAKKKIIKIKILIKWEARVEDEIVTHDPKYEAISTFPEIY